MNAVLEFFLRHFTDGLEILILSAVVYGAFLYLKGMRGTRIFMGVVVTLIGLQLISQIFDLRVLSWLLSSVSVFVAMALVVIFQPELRRVVADIASNPLFAGPGSKNANFDEIIETTVELSNRQMGAIIAIEREASLRVFSESGVRIDALFTKELMLTIFFPRTPLHDGGVIVHDDRVFAASCIFPVDKEESMDRAIGLRHRAAIGLTQETDAVVIVVSEETGSISLCRHGKLERGLKPAELRRRLTEMLLKDSDETVDAP